MSSSRHAPYPSIVRDLQREIPVHIALGDAPRAPRRPVLPPYRDEHGNTNMYPAQRTVSAPRQEPRAPQTHPIEPQPPAPQPTPKPEREQQEHDERDAQARSEMLLWCAQVGLTASIVLAGIGVAWLLLR